MPDRCCARSPTRPRGCLPAEPTFTDLQHLMQVSKPKGPILSQLMPVTQTFCYPQSSCPSKTDVSDVWRFTQGISLDSNPTLWIEPLSLHVTGQRTEAWTSRIITSVTQGVNSFNRKRLLGSQSFCSPLSPPTRGSRAGPKSALCPLPSAPSSNRSPT